jgi:hypothetical protein
MYWAYTTMTTVGYGDIAAVTLAEKVWAICTMIVSGFFFSFVVGRMASVISKLDSTRSAYNEQLDMLTTFLKDTDLPRQLSRRWGPRAMGEGRRGSWDVVGFDVDDWGESLWGTQGASVFGGQLKGHGGRGNATVDLLGAQPKRQYLHTVPAHQPLVSHPPLSHFNPSQPAILLSAGNQLLRSCPG